MKPINEITREILINKESQVSGIQAAFSGWYPFLKLEFVSETRTVQNNRTEYLPAQFAWKHLPDANNYKIDVNGSRTVAELLDELQLLLAVPVEVSRKSGKVWNKITISDDWTLQSQNDAAEFISSAMTGPALKKY